MTATQNSIYAYLDLIDTGELGKAQKKILDFIRDHPNSTYNDISRVLGLHHNTVTARIKELRDEGFIICCGTKVDDITKKSNNMYRVRRKGENPDVVVNDVRPVLPHEIISFLKKATRKEIIADELEIIRKGVRYSVRKTAVGETYLQYGEFLNIRGIEHICEDSAHNTVTVVGLSFTLKFRIN